MTVDEFYFSVRIEFVINVVFSGFLVDSSDKENPAFYTALWSRLITILHCQNPPESCWYPLKTQSLCLQFLLSFFQFVDNLFLFLSMARSSFRPHEVVVSHFAFLGAPVCQLNFIFSRDIET